MPTLAIRGATTAPENTAHAVLAATRTLLTEIVRANSLCPDELVMVYFTVTPDLTAAFPSRAARELGWTRVALLDAQAPAIQGDLERCIRVLILLNREAAKNSIHPIYLEAARALRPDLIE
ncbi:MAG: chorismate mutase [Anaerolineae bacterium]